MTNEEKLSLAVYVLRRIAEQYDKDIIDDRLYDKNVVLGSKEDAFVYGIEYGQSEMAFMAKIALEEIK